MQSSMGKPGSFRSLRSPQAMPQAQAAVLLTCPLTFQGRHGHLETRQIHLADMYFLDQNVFQTHRQTSKPLNGFRLPFPSHQTMLIPHVYRHLKTFTWATFPLNIHLRRMTFKIRCVSEHLRGISEAYTPGSMHFVVPRVPEFLPLPRFSLSERSVCAGMFAPRRTREPSRGRPRARMPFLAIPAPCRANRQRIVSPVG
jgi:hypothetical protein